MSATQHIDRSTVIKACDLAIPRLDEINKAGKIYRRGEIEAIREWARVRPPITTSSMVELTFEMFTAIPPEAWEKAGAFG